MGQAPESDQENGENVRVVLGPFYKLDEPATESKLELVLLNAKQKNCLELSR